MSNNSSSNLFLKIVWQVVLVAGLILGVWVLSQTLPIAEKSPSLKKFAQDLKNSVAAPGTNNSSTNNASGNNAGNGNSENGGNSSALNSPSNNTKNSSVVNSPGVDALANLRPTVQIFQLPRLKHTDPSAMEAINGRLVAAQSEILVAAKQIAATSILTNIKDRAAAGVSVTTILSPDVDFAQSKLAAWLVTNKITGVYKDVIRSASHIIVIDGRTVILSDVPFSQSAFEPSTQPQMQAVAFGFVTIIDDETVAGAVAKYLKARLLPQNKLL